MLSLAWLYLYIYHLTFIEFRWITYLTNTLLAEAVYFWMQGTLIIPRGWCVWLHGTNLSGGLQMVMVVKMIVMQMTMKLMPLFLTSYWHGKRSCTTKWRYITHLQSLWGLSFDLGQDDEFTKHEERTDTIICTDVHQEVLKISTQNLPEKYFHLVWENRWEFPAFCIFVAKKWGNWEQISMFIFWHMFHTYVF